MSVPDVVDVRWETTNITVSYDTPLEVIETLQSRLRHYVQQNNREWSNMALNIDTMEFQNALTLIIAMERKPGSLLFTNNG